MEIKQIMMLYTTLEEIKKHSPCKTGWAKLLKYLGKTTADDEQLSFKTIIDSNGFTDSLWCLQTVKNHDREIRLYAVWCARQVEHLDSIGIAKKTNNVTERYAKGESTQAELDATRFAAWDAARSAAWVAARPAAWVAARPAAWAAARPAAWDAAWAAALISARADARVDARDSQKQEFIKQFCTEEVLSWTIL